MSSSVTPCQALEARPVYREGHKFISLERTMESNDYFVLKPFSCRWLFGFEFFFGKRDHFLFAFQSDVLALKCVLSFGFFLHQGFSNKLFIFNSCRCACLRALLSPIIGTPLFPLRNGPRGDPRFNATSHIVPLVFKSHETDQQGEPPTRELQPLLCRSKPRRLFLNILNAFNSIFFDQ